MFNISTSGWRLPRLRSIPSCEAMCIVLLCRPEDRLFSSANLGEIERNTNGDKWGCGLLSMLKRWESNVSKKNEGGSSMHLEMNRGMRQPRGGS